MNCVVECRFYECMVSARSRGRHVILANQDLRTEERSQQVREIDQMTGTGRTGSSETLYES
jgi:hypothetical protein